MQRILLMLLMIIVTGSKLVAQQVSIGSLQQALDLAEKQSVVGIQGRFSRELASKEVAIKRSALLPQLNVYGSAEYYPVLATQVIPESIFGGQDGKFRKVQFGLPWNFSTGIELTLPVINFERQAQLYKAQLQLLEAGATARSNMEALKIQVIQYYQQALLAKELLKLNDENRRITDTLVDVLSKRKSEGVLNPADLNRAKNLQLTVMSSREDYHALLNNSLTALRFLLNIKTGESLDIRDSLSVEGVVVGLYDANSVEARAQYDEAQKKIDVAKQSVVEAKQASFPRLSLYSRYNYNWQMNDGFRGQPVHFDMNVVGLRADFPLFNGGSYRHKRSRAEIQLSAIETEREIIVNELLRQQSEWLQQYQKTVQKHAALTNRLAVVNDNIRIARLALEEGVMEYDEFHNLFTEYTQSRMEHLQNLADALVYQTLLNTFNR